MISLVRKVISITTLVIGPTLIVYSCLSSYSSIWIGFLGLLLFSWRAIFLVFQSCLMRHVQQQTGVNISIRDFLRSLIVETIWIYHIFFIEQAWLHQRKDLHFVAKGSAKTVVLIHGFAGRASCWNLFCTRLQQRNISYYRVDLSDTGISIASHADQVFKIIQAARNTSNENVDVIVHSMGGLVLRSALEQHPILEQFIHRVVFLGTPHYGTKLSIIGLTVSASQMRPDNDWLSHLSLGSTELRRRSFSYRSQVDNVVFPSCSTLLPLTTSREFKDIGHIEFVQSPIIFDQICKDLEL